MGATALHTVSPECAAVYHTRWIAWDPRGGLLRGTDPRNAPVRGSTLEHGLLRAKRTGFAVGLPSTFIRTGIESFE